MTKTPITGLEQTERSVAAKLWNVRAELLWGLAVAVVLFSTIDWVLLVSIGLALATVVAAALGFRELLHRAEQDDAQQPAAPQPLTPEERGATAQTLGYPPWRDNHAA